MDDDTLLERLGAVIRRTDPVPPDVTLAARSALAWREMDAVIAELLEESPHDPALAGVRGAPAGWRALTFETHDGVCIEVEVSGERATRSLLGQIIPPVAARVVVRRPGGETETEADGVGRFSVDGLRPGPISLRVELGHGAVETRWVSI